MTAWVATYVALPGLLLAMAGALVRLWRGPSIPDRLVGMELVSFSVLNALFVYGILFNEALYLDIGLVLALISFVATIAFARFIESKQADARLD